MSMTVPDAYTDYLRRNGVMEAFLACDPGFMQLWPIDKLGEYNLNYQVAEYAPGFFCFGSTGGGDLLAFDQAGAIYALLAIGMEPQYARRVAESWSEFESCISETPSQIACQTRRPEISNGPTPKLI